MPESDSTVVSQGACPDCSSSDAFTAYDDGHTFCFSCGTHHRNGAPPPTDPATVSTPTSEGLLNGLVFQDITRRGLTEAVCRKYGYGITEFKGDRVQVAPYYDSTGALVAQKIRTAGKDFLTLGNFKSAALFGQQLWRHGGRMVIVTEGEIDALSVAQAMSLKWAAVSIPTGAPSAAKAIKKNLEWLASHESIILWFDQDEPGRAATAECAALLPPGKVKIVTTPGGLKDANDALRELGAAEVVRLVWDAPSWRPDGIVSGTDIPLEELTSDPEAGWQTPCPELNKLTRGIHPGELWLLTAGSGIGKSTSSREWMHKAIVDGLRVGGLYLEENKAITAKALIAIDNNVPLSELRENPRLLTAAQWESSYRRIVASGRLYLYDHFGSVESDNLLSKLEYLAVACDCQIAFLDHISIAVSGLDIDEGERRALDILMTKLRSLAERTGMSIVAISHLRKVGGGGKSFEQGGQISLDDLRGSGSLKQLSDTVLAFERDQQAEDSGLQDITNLRLLKCRFTGRTGTADTMRYDRATGRQLPFDGFQDESHDKQDF